MTWDGVLKAVVVVIGALAGWVAVELIMRNASGVPTEKEVRDYELELQRKFVGRPMGSSSKTREGDGKPTDAHHL